MLVPGSTYKFEFVPVLAGINGIYEVTSIVSYNQYVLDGGDTLKDLFETNSLTEAEYATHAEEIVGSKVAYLLSKTTVQPAIPVPLCLFPKHPDTNLKPYGRLIVTLDLGIFGDQTRLEALMSAMKDIALTSVGIDNDPVLMNIDTKWLTDAEYAAIRQTREDLITNEVTYYSEFKRVQEALNRANDKISAYEAGLIALQNP